LVCSFFSSNFPFNYAILIIISDFFSFNYAIVIIIC
jgi:hypothetical protein